MTSPGTTCAIRQCPSLLRPVPPCPDSCRAPATPPRAALHYQRAATCGAQDRDRQLARLKGYVANLSVDQMTGQAVIDAYHYLW